MHMRPVETISGFCSVCGGSATFASFEPLDFPCKRNSFLCSECGSCARNRHIAQAVLSEMESKADSLAQFAQGWSGTVLLPCTSGAIHQAFAGRPGLVASEFIDGAASGETVNGVLCQDLQRTSFEDESFDLIITEDVMEHVPNPKLAFAEIRRILRPGGWHISTIPVHWDRARSQSRAVLVNGYLVHLTEPEYHGDPTRPHGILAFTDYGTDIVDEYLSIVGPTKVLEAHLDRRMEQDFAIYNSWVFVSQRPGAPLG